jgi:hypothetical protein
MNSTKDLKKKKKKKKKKNATKDSSVDTAINVYQSLVKISRKSARRPFRLPYEGRRRKKKKYILVPPPKKKIITLLPIFKYIVSFLKAVCVAVRFVHLSGNSIPITCIYDVMYACQKICEKEITTGAVGHHIRVSNLFGPCV